MGYGELLATDKVT